MAKEQPEIRIIAGPNGAGKTTFAKEFLPRYATVENFINADLIAAGLAPFAPANAAVRAGRLVLEEIRRFAAARVNFSFETTLADRTYEAMLREFRSQGYLIFLYFLWLPDVAYHLDRVANRVRLGGHFVPDDDVKKRDQRSVWNFLRIYRPLTDFWIVFENSGVWPREIAFARADVPTILNEAMFQRFLLVGQNP